MDLNSLVFYLDSHSEQYEECYNEDKNKFLRIAHSLFSSLPNCNISSLDIFKFNTYLRVIRSLLKKNEVFGIWDYVKNTIDFVLLSIPTIKCETQHDFALELLSLLADILKGIQETHCKVILDKKRIIEAVIHISRDNAQTMKAILNILDIILKLQGATPENLNYLCEMILDMANAQQNVTVICILGKIVLKISTEFVGNITQRVLQWIFKKSFLLIEKGTEVHIKREILELIEVIKSIDIAKLESVYPKFSDDNQIMWNGLMEKSDILWYLCEKNTTINELAEKVLSETLLQFFIREKMVYSDEHTIMEEIRQFFPKIKANTYILEKYFFFICHMQELYSRLSWNPKFVVHCMANYFYEKQSELDIPLLKSFFYLFPCISSSFSKPEYIAWCNDFLRTMVIYSVHPGIYSLSQKQLVWILKMGSRQLKIEVVRHWINNPLSHRCLITEIIRCKAGSSLMDLMMEDFDKETGKTAACFLRKLKNEHISSQIAEMLPVVCNKPKIFNCLILSRPSLPEHPEVMMFYVAMMGSLMPSFTDFFVLRAACIYTNDIIERLRKNPNCINIFSTCNSIIEFLLHSSEKSPENVAKEILYLLRNLVCLQVKYQYKIKSGLEADLTGLFKGSLQHIQRYLKVIPILLRVEGEPLIKLKNKSILTLWYKIMDLIEHQETYESAIKCLQIMMTKYEWIALTSSLNSFVSILCWQQLDQEKSKLFLNFFITWLKILMKTPNFLRPAIPYADIQSFVMRDGNLSRINFLSKLFKKMKYNEQPSNMLALRKNQ